MVLASVYESVGITSPPPSITSIEPEFFLLFSAFGMLILVFSLRMHLDHQVNLGRLSRRSDSKAAPINSFVKDIFDLGWLYFLSAILIVISTFNADVSYLNSSAYNLGVYLSVGVTVWLLLRYLSIVVDAALQNYIRSQKYNI